jgi:hypothetical protein
MSKKILFKIDRFLSSFLVSPYYLIKKFLSIPTYIKNMATYNSFHQNTKFQIKFSNLLFTTTDRNKKSGEINSHYFHQDLWAAKKIFENNVSHHIDVGSRLDGFVAHLLPFCNVDYIDIRLMENEIDKLNFIKGSILELPYEDNSVKSLSCLHVLEHIGLGRYGDKINPNGYIEAANELQRVLAPSCYFYFSTPVGKEKLYFDAHRVFAYETIINIFNALELLEFNFIPDKADKIIYSANPEITLNSDYGCGLFLFSKSI